MNLRDVLFDPTTQIELIQKHKADLADMVRKAEKETSPGLVYGSPQEKPPAPDPSVLSLADLVRDGPEIDLSQLRHMLTGVVAQLDDACTKSPLSLTWVVLSLMFVRPALRNAICEHTKRNIAESYFTGYEKRFTEALCGIVVPKKPRKRKHTPLSDAQTVTPSLDPLEIVLTERRFFRQCEHL